MSPKPAQNYFLTDVGAQWNSSLADGQQVLAVLEAYPGQNGWQGAAYTGASSALVRQDSLALTSLPDAVLRPVPVAKLLQAGPSQIQLSVGHYDDLSGQALGLSLWRRNAGSNSWAWMGSMANPASATAWADISVTAEAAV